MLGLGKGVLGVVGISRNEVRAGAFPDSIMVMILTMSNVGLRSHDLFHFQFRVILLTQILANQLCLRLIKTILWTVTSILNVGPILMLMGIVSGTLMKWMIMMRVLVIVIILTPLTKWSTLMFLTMRILPLAVKMSFQHLLL